ncbi:hypothetical protein F442_21939 [Phytophthora nicotianae P10297]|uniref:Mechanosensitive ion channel MscS porin domain-containing protein n=1 Tax=Phytophthora nicotianae P10297 TaxID=1317064 RepID=W2Y3R3_PHYNI|nr:hypothetical protein F442_21939 [Phytophthora nicotianae P10297]
MHSVYGARRSRHSVDHPSLDFADVRASSNALQHAINQTEALHELHQDNEVLCRKCLATRRRAKDLDRQLADAANAASPYVLFCQHKSVWITPPELEACRLRYRDLELRYDEAVSQFQGRISTLEAQLIAASSFGVIVPPDTARRIADLESQLARSHSDLQVERDRRASLTSELRESATSPKAAQAEVDRLEAAIERKTRRFRALRESYGRRLKVADNTIAAHSVEIARLQGRVSTLDQELQQVSQRVRAAISQCGQARAERSATQDRVSAARDTVARLERRINQVERSQMSRQDLETALATLRQERDRLVVQKDELLSELGERLGEITGLRAERDQAQKRLSNIAALLPSDPSRKRARTESSSPARSTRSSKTARSTLGSFPASASTQGPVPGSSIEVLSTVAASQSAGASPSSAAHDVASPMTPPRSKRASVAFDSSAGPPDRPARSIQSSKLPARGSSRGALSPPAESESGASSDGDDSLSNRSSSTRGLDSDTAESGSDSSASNAELADLPSTRVPRTEWIPGYRDRCVFHGHDVVPWSAQDIRQTSIVEMDVDLLFHRFAKPMERLFPLRDPTPQLEEWRDDLMDESNIRDLIESAPWEVLALRVDPLTF